MDSIWSKAYLAENLGTRLMEETCETKVSTENYHSINYSGAKHKTFTKLDTRKEKTLYAGQNLVKIEQPRASTVRSGKSHDKHPCATECGPV